MNDRPLAINALDLTLRRRCPCPGAGLRHQSDQGSTRASESFQQVPEHFRAQRAGDEEGRVSARSWISSGPPVKTASAFGAGPTIATRVRSSVPSNRAVIIALFSRFVGWILSAVNDRPLAINALGLAFRRRCPGAGLRHHSDQGSTWASESCPQVLVLEQLRAQRARAEEGRASALTCISSGSLVKTASAFGAGPTIATRAARSTHHPAIEQRSSTAPATRHRDTCTPRRPGSRPHKQSTAFESPPDPLKPRRNSQEVANRVA